MRTSQVSVALFVLMEGFAWYVGMRALASNLTRDAFRVLEGDIARVTIGAGEGLRVERALAIAREATANATAGPPLLAVLAGAAAAMLLVRLISKMELPLPLAAVVGVAASLVAFHVLLHVSVTGDLRVWEASGLLALLGAGGEYAAHVDGASFIEHPDPSRVVRESLVVLTIGLVLLWVRFLLAGRGPMTYERVLRSFSVGFALLLVITTYAHIGSGVTVLGLVIAYFVLGVLALAVAHTARSSGLEGTAGRATPWLVSLAVTLGALAGVALLIGMLALLDVQRAFQPVVGALLSLMGRVALLALLPFAYVMQWILELIFGGRTLDLEQLARNLQALQETPNPEGAGNSLPSWLTNGTRAVITLTVVWILYRVGKMLFTRVRRAMPTERYEEARLAVEVSAPGGGLFGGLFRGRRTAPAVSSEWLRLHPIYALFSRVVGAANERGLPRRPGETPVEFARHAYARFDQPPFEPIALAFDRARYGRHFPEAEVVTGLEQQLGEWERAHPVIAERATAPEQSIETTELPAPPHQPTQYN